MNLLFDSRKFEISAYFQGIDFSTCRMYFILFYICLFCDIDVFLVLVLYVKEVALTKRILCDKEGGPVHVHCRSAILEQVCHVYVLGLNICFPYRR
jgi:hypothetical protein